MVIGSRPFSGQGQVVKAHFWPVKDLDPGRGRINRVYGSDPPLYIVHKKLQKVSLFVGGCGL